MMTLLIQRLKSPMQSSQKKSPELDNNKQKSVSSSIDVKYCKDSNRNSKNVNEEAKQKNLSAKIPSKQQKIQKTCKNQIKIGIPSETGQFKSEKRMIEKKILSMIQTGQSQCESILQQKINQFKKQIQSLKEERQASEKYKNNYDYQQKLIQGKFHPKVYKTFQCEPKNTINSFIRYSSQKRQISFEYQLKLEGEALTLKKSQDLSNCQILEDIEIQAPQILPFLIHQFQQQSRPSKTELQNTEKYVKQNIKYLKQFKIKVYQKQISFPLIILKRQIQAQYDRRVIFQDKQDFNTALSIKNYCAKPYQNLIRFTYKIEQNDVYNFSLLINPDNKKRLQQFIQDQKQKLSEIFNVPKSQVYIYKLSKGSIIVDGAVATDYYRQLLYSDCGFTRLFKDYRLSQSCFDIKFNTCFVQKYRCESLLQRRGSYPYYPPFLCQRFSLNVWNKFKGKNQWLGCSHGQTKQWAVGMHGTNIHAKYSIIKKDKVQNPNSQQQTVISSMLKGFNQNKMLLPGQRQAVQYEKNARNINTKVGRGVYFTPYYESSLRYSQNWKNYQQQKKSLHSEGYYSRIFNTVIQCRINPDKIAISQHAENNNVWVVQKPQHIRPYGILISLKQDYQQTKTYFEQLRSGIKLSYQKNYKNTFSFIYSEWKDQIQKYCKNFKPKQAQSEAEKEQNKPL